MSAAGTSAVIGRRIAAVIAAASAALHGVMLGHVGSPAAAVLIGGMVVVCLYCAWELWRSSTTRAWTLVALMNLAMVAVHLPLAAGHHITHVDLESVVPHATTMTMTAATALSIVEVAIAVAVLCYRARGNAKVVGGTE